METRRSLLFSGLMLLGLLALGAKGESGGCGGSNLFEGLSDKESREAKIEEARIALDSRDFTKAITILQEYCGTNALQPTCDAKTASLYAAGFVGRGGLDAIKLIGVATTAAAGGFTTAEGLTTFSQLLRTSTSSSLTDLNNAVNLLSVTAGTDPNRNLQLAAAAASNIVALLGSFTGGFTSTGVPTSTTNATAANLATVTAQINQSILLMSVGVANSGVTGADLSSNVETLKQCLSYPTTGAKLNAVVTNLSAGGTAC